MSAVMFDDDNVKVLNSLVDDVQRVRPCVDVLKKAIAVELW